MICADSGGQPTVPDHSPSTDERASLALPRQSSSPLECTFHFGFSLGEETRDAKESAAPLSDYANTEAYVLVAEPGAGKTTAFKTEAVSQGGEYVTVRDFRAFEDKPEWHGTTLFLDGLDESRAGAADRRTPLDDIRRKLYLLGCPRFRLSCWWADWQAENDSVGVEAAVGPHRELAAGSAVAHPPHRLPHEGRTTVTAIPDIPVLDVTQLNATHLDATVKIFDDLEERTMLPANEAWRDAVRQELDQRLLIEVLGLDDKAVDQLGILRRQWCSEPTVTSTKKTGPPN